MYEQKASHSFPLLAHNTSVYLDNSATAQKPGCVLDAQRYYYEHHNANPMRGLYPLSVAATDCYESARKKVQTFLNAKETAEIVFTRNTTEAINLVAYSYGLSFITKGDEIVVSVMEHHSNLLPWQMVAKQTGAKLVYLMCESDGTFSKEELDRVFTPRTKLVAVTHVSNVLGRINPIEDIVARARAVDAVVMLDIAQSVPHIPVDVQALDVDFAAASGHKMFGPMGIGLLYGKRDLLEKMPPFMSGGEMIESVTLTGATYAPVPHKFEAGTVNVADAVGLSAAIDFMLDTGFETMIAKETRLTHRLVEGLQKLPHVHILGSQNPEEHIGIVTFVIDNVHPHDVSAVLESDGIDVRAGHHCAQPLLAHLGVRSATRASLMFYNTEAEIDTLIASVASVREKMGFE